MQLGREELRTEPSMLRLVVILPSSAVDISTVFAVK
jgi:hypothetical protein